MVLGVSYAPRTRREPPLLMVPRIVPGVVVSGRGLGRVLACLVIPGVPQMLEMEVFVPPI